MLQHAQSAVDIANRALFQHDHTTGLTPLQKHHIISAIHGVINALENTWPQIKTSEDERLYHNTIHAPITWPLKPLYHQGALGEKLLGLYRARTWLFIELSRQVKPLRMQPEALYITTRDIILCAAKLRSKASLLVKT